MPNLYDLVDKTDLECCLDAGLIARRQHKDAQLDILNYTARATFTNVWTEAMHVCRGLIVNRNTNEVVSRPFRKFWNYNDSRHPETLPENLPPYEPFVTKKYDGSLGIGYKRGSKWCVATRGSFHSEQAEWATKWLRSSKTDVQFPDGWTPLFEIVYATNKIVVDYDWEGLVLIGMVNNETGAEIAPEGLRFIAEANDLRPAMFFTDPVAVSDLLAHNLPNEEGYVLAYHVGDGAPLRVKIKMADYVRLHRLVHQTSPVTIWEMMQDDDDVVELVANAPDAMRDWITRVRAEINAEWHAIYDHAYHSFNDAPKGVSRKEFAEYAKKQHHLTPLLFALLDSKHIGYMVWKMVRPTNAQPFKQEEA